MEIPRIRGRVGQAEEDNKWYFEMSMWNFEGTQMIGEPLGTFGPWETEEIAKAKMRKASEICLRACTGPNGEVPQGYIDLKNGGEYRELGREQ